MDLNTFLPENQTEAIRLIEEGVDANYFYFDRYPMHWAAVYSK